jgi:hypothetical protein
MRFPRKGNGGGPKAQCSQEPESSCPPPHECLNGSQSRSASDGHASVAPFRLLLSGGGYAVNAERPVEFCLHRVMQGRWASDGLLVRANDDVPAVPAYRDTA